MPETTPDTKYYQSKAVRHHAWRNVENSAQYLVPVLHEIITHTPKLQLLDVGAGSGTISASLATYIPQGHVTATDLSTTILESAKQHAIEKGVKNISFQQASILSLPFADNTFDVVHASQVLAHLDNPVKAFREMLRVTKPGGVVADRESDLRMWAAWPEPEGLAVSMKLHLETIKGYGGDGTAAAKLVSWAMQAGAKREHITASFGTWTYATPNDREIWGGTMAAGLRKGAQYDKALELGYKEGQLEEFAQSWERWVATEDATFGAMQGEVLIKKQA